MRGHPNDVIALASLELAEQSGRSSDALGERARTHGTSDLEIPEIVGEIEKTIAELDAGHVLAHEHGLFRKFTLWHSPALPRSYTEQLGIEEQPASLIKPHNGSPISLTQFGTVSSLFPCRGPLRRNQRPKYSSAS